MWLLGIVSRSFTSSMSRILDEGAGGKAEFAAEATLVFPILPPTRTCSTIALLVASLHLATSKGKQDQVWPSGFGDHFDDL